MIITIRETETCQRCGEERVVSENKEVTSLEVPDDVAADSEPEEDPPAATEPDASESESAPPLEPTTETDTEPVEEAEGEGAEGAEPVTEAETDAVDDEPPVTDDAEILDEDDDDIDRSPGEWPQEADPETSHDEEDFDQYGYMDENETSADDEATDAEFIDEEPTDLEDVDGMDEEPPEDAETNAWPSETEDEEPVESRPPTGPGAVTVPDGDFVCRGCGFSTPVEESSLREGDFCPECHKETLVQVREQ